MKSDCRNDCLDALIFPKKLHNRPGLSRIDYRIGTYSDFREAMFRALDKDSLLADWTHREADDPGIALLEGASILGDMLTFYQELYANEAYLRTAQWRESIAGLVQLLGYRLSPGLGGRGTFAFDVGGDNPIIVPAGFPLQAQLDGRKELVEFETVGETTVYPWLSKFNLYRRLYTPERITSETKEFRISSPDPFLNPTSLEKGDRLIIGDPDPAGNPTRLNNAEIVIIDSIRELHGITLLKIKGSLKYTRRTGSVTGFKIGRSFHHFGYNAPRYYTTMRSSSTTTSIGSIGNNIRWTDGSTEHDYTNRILTCRELPLEFEVQDLARGARIVVQSSVYEPGPPRRGGILPRKFAHVRIIEETSLINMQWGALESPSTLVTLNNSIYESPYRIALVDRIYIHEIRGPLFTFRAGVEKVEETADESGKELYFFGTNSEVQTLKDRKLVFVKPDGRISEANVLSVQNSSFGFSGRSGLRQITLDRDVNYNDFPNENPITTVYGNLIEATQGKTQREAVLGNGDSRQAFQYFKLPKAPLTYFNDAGENPPEAPELEIYVNELRWTRVSSLFGRGPEEEIYVVREDEENNSWVQFGDGKTGARLPSGLKNVVAKYRTGTGAFGPLKEETTVQAGDRLTRLKKIQLPGIISGGEEPESGEKAREAAPGKIQSLDRLVSLQDFESETLAIPGVSKARATWGLIDETVPGVRITVLMERGREDELENVRQILARYNRCRGPQRFPIQVVEGNLEYVLLTLICGVSPAYKRERVERAVREALGVCGDVGNGEDSSKGLFGLASRAFGQAEYASRVIATVQNVEGVEWVTLSALRSLGEADDPAELVIPDHFRRVDRVVPCDYAHVLSLYERHLGIGFAEAVAEEC